MVKYRIAAKTDMGLVRTNNEDNLCVISCLDNKGSSWNDNEVLDLGALGALLVVADGMGGMNAGEVASDIAVSVARERFTNEIDSVDLSSDASIVDFMNETIVLADRTIKEEGKRRPDAKGMGTTIVIGWLIDGKLYLSWCGDSRAYLYNPCQGLFQISKDHSYVQELVDKGIVRPEDAFDFPESNVITRCLSHSKMEAVPENIPAPYLVSNGDIILLCTDGLSGMIRDDEIAAVVSEHIDDMRVCVDSLIEAAKVAAGADNVTVCLCQILDGGKVVAAPANATSSTGGSVQGTNAYTEMKKKAGKRNRRRSVVAALLTVVILAILAVVFLKPQFGIFKDNSDGKNDSAAAQNVIRPPMDEASDPAEKNDEEVKGGRDKIKNIKKQFVKKGKELSKPQSGNSGNKENSTGSSKKTDDGKNRNDQSEKKVNYEDYKDNRQSVINSIGNSQPNIVRQIGEQEPDASNKN